MNKTLHGVLLFLIIGTGTFLRFHGLDRQSLWDDEMSTLTTISLPRTQVVHRFKVYEVHPPLYFVQLKLWTKLAGRSLVRIRANSAFWGVIAIGLIYLLGRRYSGEAGGLMAAALLACSPLHLAYSQEARPYALALVLACGALLALEQALDRRTVRAWSVTGLAWSALLYTHYWGGFVLAAQACYGILRGRSTGQERRVIGTAVAAAGFFCAWLPILAAQLSVIRELSFWVPPFSLLHPLKSLVSFTGLYFNVASYVFYVPTRLGYLVAFGLAFAALLVWGIVKGPLSAVIWLALGVGIPWLISIQLPGIYVWYRYPILVYPAFVLLMAAGARQWRPVWAARLLLGACLGAQLWGCCFYFGGWQKANPKAVVQYIHTLRQPNTIVVRPAYFANLYNFYDQSLMIGIDEDVLDSPEKRAALKGKHIIFVAFDSPDPVGAALRQEFPPISGRYFPGFAHLGITVWELR